VKLSGRVAWVTGAAAGIGAAIAHALARERARVFVADIDAAAAERTAESIREAGGVAWGVGHDASSESDWERVLADVRRLGGGLQILINNAGIAPTGDMIETLALADWRRSMAVNLDGVFLGTRLGIRAMQSNAPPGGTIINVSSILGLVGTAGAPDYVAAKGGVRMLSKAAALECAQSGYPIRVNSVHPGYVHTPMLERGVARMVDAGVFPNAAAGIGALASLHPLARLASAEEIATTVAFLASDDASFMTGSELVVDGGYTAR
jgi:3(or 17)beta-hydroxysteroid dehydrogenase